MAGEEVLSWQEFGVAVEHLAHRVRIDGFRPDAVLSVARGGLALGMALGYALDVKRLSTINVELYTGVDQRLAQPHQVPPLLDPADLAGLRVLVADDVADTGITLRHVLELCADHVAEARVAVVYEKPRSVVAADWAWRSTTAWVDFPWSARVPVPRTASG